MKEVNLDVKLLISSGKFSVSEWFIEPEFFSVSLLNLFRKWLYENVKANRVLGIRIDDSIIFLENNEKISESNLEIINKLRSVNFKDNSNLDNRLISINLKKKEKVLYQDLFDDLDESFNKKIFVDSIKDDIKFDFIVGTNLENSLVHEGMDFISVNKDVNDVIRCHYKDVYFKKNTYRLYLETKSEMNHGSLILKFKEELNRLEKNFKVEDNSSRDFFSTDNLNELGISERDIQILRTFSINSLGDLKNKFDEINFSSISLDSTIIIKYFRNEIKLSS